jgi:hypothetical protein
MKMMMIMMAGLITCFCAYSQDIPASQVPAAVTKAFKAKFPKTTGLEWEKKGDLYEAEFDVSLVDHKALYEASGKLVAFKKDIRKTDLPAAVKRAIETQYKGFRIDDADRVERGGAVFYQVELDGKPDDQKLVFTKDGKVDSTQQYW